MAALARLKNRPRDRIIGINIGANAKSEDRIADYETGLDVFSSLADYLVVNISSPNTAQLRDLQAPDALDALLSRLSARRTEMAARGEALPPLVVKLAPDIADEDLPLIVERLMAHAVDGIAVSNTTIARDKVAGEPLADEAGGLSGAPLFERSTRMLARVYRLTDGTVPLIGIGGIDTGRRAVEKIAAGASLLQLYTGPYLCRSGAYRRYQVRNPRGSDRAAGILGRRIDRPGRGSLGRFGPLGSVASRHQPKTLNHRRRATETVQNRQLVLFCNARSDLAGTDVGFHCGSAQRAVTLHLFDDFLLLALKNPVRQAGFSFVWCDCTP